MSDDDEILPHQVLDGDRLRSLFAEVDEEIGLKGPSVDVVICGGAALALRWDGRATTDVDALGKFPTQFVGAMNIVGSRHGLKPDWFNYAASVFRPEGLRTETVYEGENLHVQAVTRPYLLAMKAYAARLKDVDDIERLMAELGVTSSQLLPLINQAYDQETVEAHEGAINRLIANLSAREQERRERNRPGDSIGL